MDFKRKTILGSVLVATGLAMASGTYVITLDSTANYDLTTSIDVPEEWSEWSDTGSAYDCDTWSPDVSTVDWNVPFTQERDCSQDQTRERDVYEHWSSGSQTYKETETESQTITVTESRSAVGTRKLREMCINILNRGSSVGNGIYTVDPDGDGSAYAPRSAYCDMSGGGWTLYDSFGTKSILTGGSNPTAYNYNNVNSASTLTSAGYNYSLTSINTTTYTTSDYYMQFFYSSAPEGYIRKTMPSWIEGVRVDTTNEWYGGTQSVAYGSSTKYIAAFQGYTKNVYNMTGNQLLTIKESGIVWVDAVWVK